jgi:hypothetical protein
MRPRVVFDNSNTTRPTKTEPKSKNEMRHLRSWFANHTFLNEYTPSPLMPPLGAIKVINFAQKYSNSRKRGIATQICQFLSLPREV